MTFTIRRRDIANRAAHPPLAKWYDRYLLSKDWATRKTLVKERSGSLCELCKKRGKRHKAKHVHHKTYERVMAEPLTDLIHLCEKCHIEIHHTQIVPFIDVIYDEKYLERRRSGTQFNS